MEIPSFRASAMGSAGQTEKQFAQKAGLQPVPYHAVCVEQDVEAAAAEIGFPSILKSNTLGYDGKGQYVVNDLAGLKAAYDTAGKVECILEKRVDIACEISAIVARNTEGDIAAFPVSENQHRNGILHMSIVPARVDESLSTQAMEWASILADAMCYVGVLAVEFFVTTKDT